MNPIRSQFEDDPDMLEIVCEFAAEFPAKITAMEACLSEDDLDHLKLMAHQLKGAGGGYGFPQITEAAASLEQALRESAEPSSVKERLGVLCEVLAAVRVREEA